MGNRRLRYKMRTIRSRRAVSPVIATVILVAVAITVAVAVAYWMGGIAGQYTKFEKVEIQSAVCKWDGTQDQWNITIKLKNTGTRTATLIGIFISDIEVDAYTGLPTDGQATTDMGETRPISSGVSDTIHIYIDGPGGTDGWEYVTTGTTVNIKIHSAGGMDYYELLELV